MINLYLTLVFAISMAFILFLVFSITKDGLADFRMGFLFKLSKLLESKSVGIDQFNVNNRRMKTKNDISVVAKKYEGVQVLNKIINDKIPVRYYKTMNIVDSSAHALIVYFHGGGYVLGDLDYSDNICKALAIKTNASVISVDYSLAPENQYPIALQQGEEVIDFLFNNCDSDFQFNKNNIFVMGDSAGGNLAACLCLSLKEKGMVDKIKGQILIYPVTDFSNMNTKSYNTFNGYMLPKSDMEWFRKCYIPNSESSENPLISPLLAKKIDNLPKAFVISAQFDVLHDEVKAYAEKLKAAGNIVVYKNVKGVSHGFLSMDAFLPHGNKIYSMIKEFIK